MTLKVQAIRKWISKKTSGLNKGRTIYCSFLACSLMPLLSDSAFAADNTIWQKASAIMNDIYTQILGFNHRRHRDGKHCAATDELFQIRSDGR